MRELKYKSINIVPFLIAVGALVILLMIIKGANLISRNTGALPGSSSNQKITLEYWGIYEPAEVMNVLIKDYEASHSNVTIRYSERNLDNNLVWYKKSLLTRLKERNAPAMFRVHSTWIPEYLKELSGSNTNMTSSGFGSRFYKVAEDQCVTDDGVVFCVPLMYDGLVLLYNQSMFDSEGLGEPTTWDDVRDSAIRLTKRSNDGRVVKAGVAMGTADNVVNSTDILGLMFAQSQVTVPDSLDTEAAAAALTFYTNFVRQDKVWSSDMPDSITAFATEKVAMVFANSSQIEDVLKLNPTLRFKAIPVPQLPDLKGGVTNETWASFWVETVNADISDEEQQAAWAFLNWLSLPDQQRKFREESLKYHRIGNAYSDKTLRNQLSDNPYLSVVVKQAPYAKTSIITDVSGNDKYANVIKKAIKSVNGDKENRRKQVDVEKALETAKKELKKLLK